jgi:hypothetical protein
MTTLTTTDTCALCGEIGGDLVGIDSKRWHTACALKAAAHGLNAIPFPASWTPPPFRFGQGVFLRDSGNRRFLVVGLAFNRGIASGDWWDVGVIKTFRDIRVDWYSAGELSADPLADEDPDYLAYRAGCGTLDWHAWRNLFDRYEELIPTMWQTPTPPEPPELTDLKRTLLLDD